MKAITPTLGICLAAVAAAIVAAVADLGAASSPAGVYGGPAALSIHDYTFSPALVTPGASVTVTNLDPTAHTVTSDAGGLFDTKDVPGGRTVTFTAPTAPGSYPYHCAIHSTMHGTLVVSTP